MSNSCRLYLITPPRIDDFDAFSRDFTAALGAGDVACVQLRLKSETGAAPDEDILRAAEKLAPIARSHEVAFLINDRPDLAKKAGVDGVHIGQSDGTYEAARALLGEGATVGVTCHNSKDLALVAGEAGADYVAFGAFFPTATKQSAAKAALEILEWWAYATTVPSVAIGGINPENCERLIRAGADFLAVSSAVWNHPGGPGKAVKEFTATIANA